MLERTQYALHREGDRCAVATGAETVLVWRLPSDPEQPPATEPESKIETGRSPLRGVAFITPTYLLTVHQLGECVIWQLPERRELPTADPEASGAEDQGEGLPAPSDASSDDGADREQGETALAPTDGEAPAEKKESESPEIPVAGEKWSRELGVEIAAFQARTRDGSTADRIAIGGRDGELVVAAVDRSGSSPLVFGRTDAHENDVTCLSFAPRSERIATGGRDHRIAVWSTDPSDFEERDDPSSEAQSEQTEAGSDADGESSSGEESEQQAKIDKTLDAPEIPRRLVLEGSEGWPLTVEFSGDGTRLASTALDNSLYLWDPRADEPLQRVVNRHDNWVSQLAWSPDDTALATGSWDTTIGVFRANDLTPDYRFDLHTDFVSGLAFLEKPGCLVSASYDGRLGLWDWESGELVDHIEAHADWIEVMVVLGDIHVLTISSEDVIRIWDVEAGERVAELGDASYEGFDLGRAVDFSDYIEVPELSSDLLGRDTDAQLALETVRDLSERKGPADEASESAVSLLEDAIETDLQNSPTAELGEGGGEAGRELLESRLEESGTDAGTAGTETAAEEPETDASADSSLPEPGEATNPDPADEGEVEEAFSEISEVNLDELKTKREDHAPEDSEEDQGEEAIDQFGESIDERVDDTSLDMPDEIDTGEGEEDLEATAEEVDDVGGDTAPAGPDASGDETTSLGDGASPTLGGRTKDASTGSERRAESPSSNAEQSESGPSADSSPQLGEPADQRRREREDDVGGDTLTSGAGPSDPEVTPSSPGPGREESTDSETSEQQPSAESAAAAETTEIDTAASEDDAEPPTSSGSEESEPSAKDLKEKFRKLKDSESDGSSDDE